VIEDHQGFGRCPCGGTYEFHLVEVRATVAGELKILQDIPQGRCPSCGGRVYKPETLEFIEASVMRPDATAALEAD
jgi:YgiT-type zinc finger domain-containing protein